MSTSRLAPTCFVLGKQCRKLARLQVAHTCCIQQQRGMHKRCLIQVECSSSLTNRAKNLTFINAHPNLIHRNAVALSQPVLVLNCEYLTSRRAHPRSLPICGCTKSLAVCSSLTTRATVLELLCMHIPIDHHKHMCVSAQQNWPCIAWTLTLPATTLQHN